MSSTLQPGGDTIDYRKLFETLAEGVVIHDAQGLIIDANPAALELLGLSLDQMKGRSSIDPRWHAIHLDGSDFPGEEHPAQVALRTGKPVMEVPMGVFNPKKNDYTWLLINATPTQETGSQGPVSVYASFTDITKKVFAEQKLKEETELHQTLVEVSSAFINLSEKEIKSVIQSNLEQLGRFVEADRMYIFEYDWDTYTTSNTYEWCAEGIEPQIEYLQNYSMEGMEDWANSHKIGKPTYVEEVSKLDPEDQLRKTLEPQGIQSLLTLPIMYQSQCLGFLGLDSVKKVHHYSEGELTILRIFADILSNVHSRIQMERNEKERLKELQSIFRVTALCNDNSILTESLLEDSVDLIQAGFLIPKKTYVRINWKSRTFTTYPFKETEKSVKKVAELNTGDFLYLEVFIEPSSQFLQEEDNYLDTLLSTLQQSINSRENLEKIKESEGRLKSLLNSQTNYILRTDLYGRHTFWNHKFEEDFGYLYHKKGLEESDSLTSICEYDHEKAIEVVKKCIAEPNKSFPVELDKPSKNGGIMTTRWEFVCLTDAQGNPYEMQCEGLDISDIRKAEKELKESEKKYRFLFEEAPEGYLVIKDGVFVECNHTSEKMIGGSRKDIIGKHPFDISPKFQPDGELSEVKAEAILKSTLMTGGAKFEWVHTKTDGTEFLTEIKLSKIEMDGQEVIFTTWKDITESRKLAQALEESESRFSQIAEHSGAVIWETDDVGLYTYVSPVSKQVFGYEPEELVGKKYFYDLFPEAYSEKFTKEGLAHLFSGKSLGNWENPIQRKDGTVIWVNTFGTPIIDKSGKFMGYRGSDTDITDRKIAQDELQKFRNISDRATYGTVITKVENREITYCNQAFAEMHGYTIEELIGQCIEVLHTPEQLDYFQKTYLPIYKRDKEYSMAEFGRKRKDGTTFPALVNVKQFADEKGNPLFNASSVIDISERKKQEELIQEQNTRLSAIIDSIPDNLYVIDREGNYLELLNTPKNEPKELFFNAVGKNIRDLFDESKVELHLRKINEAFDTGQIITYEYEGVIGHDDLHYEARLVKISDQKMLRLIRDITDRKLVESEVKKLTLAIEQSPVAVIITDLEARLQYMSPAFLMMTGYTYDEMIGQPIGTIKSGLTNKETYSDLWETIKTGNPWHKEWINKRKDGTLFWEYILINPIRNEKGEITNYLAVKQDITQRKRYEEEIIELNHNLEARIEQRTWELEKAKIEADEANKAKSEFLSRMSHELRTPMNSILGFAQLMEYTELTPMQHRNIEFILKSGNHLLNLINEVLDISRIEAGKVSISLEPVELFGAIQDVTESLQPISLQKNVEIKYPSKKGDGIYVRADLQRVKQVLFNLINNAVKYNRPNGSVTISIQTDKDFGIPSGFTRVMIEDTGIGIEESNLKKLFTPFERGGLETSSIEGTGLGLSVVEKLVELMEGKVGVKSEIGVGSSFWVDFPSINLEPNTTLNQDQLILNQVAAKSSEKILLVEDNQVNIELISNLVQNINPNFELLITKYGKEALSLAETEMPDLILLDLHLPDTHGKEVIKSLKQNKDTQSIPVIIVSADANPARINELLELGAAQYVTKPINVNQMIQIISSYSK